MFDYSVLDADSCDDEIFLNGPPDSSNKQGRRLVETPSTSSDLEEPPLHFLYGLHSARRKVCDIYGYPGPEALGMAIDSAPSSPEAQLSAGQALSDSESASVSTASDNSQAHFLQGSGTDHESAAAGDSIRSSAEPIHKSRLETACHSPRRTRYAISEMLCLGRNCAHQDNVPRGLSLPFLKFCISESSDIFAKDGTNGDISCSCDEHHEGNDRFDHDTDKASNHTIGTEVKNIQHDNINSWGIESAYIHSQPDDVTSRASSHLKCEDLIERSHVVMASPSDEISAVLSKANSESLDDTHTHSHWWRSDFLSNFFNGLLFSSANITETVNGSTAGISERPDGDHEDSCCKTDDYMKTDSSFCLLRDDKQADGERVDDKHELSKCRLYDSMENASDAISGGLIGFAAVSRRSASQPEVVSEPLISPWRPQAMLPVTDSSKRRPAAYYGICDLKYDRGRVCVLELGNGRLSRFSGHGEAIPRRYRELFRPAKVMDRSALVDNKKMTHDVFVECGLEYFRPRQACFAREYTCNLAADIVVALALSDQPNALVVLKLLNRCRGAGVVVSHIGEELDGMLKRLLCPPKTVPSGKGVSLDVALSWDPSSLDEQCLHWWSNECPVFVAEHLEMSSPIQMGDGFEYDATMRVGFVVLRDSQSDENQNLSIEFLGGYWKLPLAPLNSLDIRGRCVSRARSSTALVDVQALDRVYGELGYALTRVFSYERVGVNATTKRYSKNPLLYAYTMARHASVQLQRETAERARLQSTGAVIPRPMPGPHNMLKAAEQRLSSYRAISLTSRQHNPSHERQHCQQSLPERYLFSYIHRLRGIWYAQHAGWSGANVYDCLTSSLRLHGANASTEHLMGIAALHSGDVVKARSKFLSSINLDPDYKAAYINLSFATLRQHDWDSTIKVCTVGLRRHPQAFQCSYNLGLAQAHTFRARLRDNLTSSTLCAKITEAALAALWDAKEQQECKHTEWSNNDNELMASLEHMYDSFVSHLYDPADYDIKEELVYLGNCLDRTNGWKLYTFRL